MSASAIIKDILESRNIKQIELAEKINTTKQNLNNKINRDNFSTLELVEIADALGLQLVLRSVTEGKEYIIDYPTEEKGKPKRTKIASGEETKNPD